MGVIECARDSFLVPTSRDSNFAVSFLQIESLEDVERAFVHVVSVLR